MNYAELLSATQDYVESTETSLVNRLPLMIQNVERAIYQTVHLPALRKNQLGNLTAGNKYLTVPTDFLAPYALSVIVPAVAPIVGPPAVPGAPSYQQFLLNKDVEFMREAFPEPTDQGPSTHYGMFDSNTFIVCPTPDQSYQVELHYFFYPESIVTAGTTWLSTDFPNALLYGTIVEAYVYLKGEPERLTDYKGLFADAMEQLKQLGDGQKRQDTFRTKATRVKVV